MPLDVEQLYRRYGPMVLRRCRKLLRNEEDAVDAMQDVFVRATRGRNRLEMDSPAALLLKMATQVCLNRIAEKGRKPEDGDQALLYVIATNEDSESRTHARFLLQSLFRKEKETTRLAAVLHYLDGLTLEETAAEVGLSVSGVRQRLRRLHDKLHSLNEVVHV